MNPLKKFESWFTAERKLSQLRLPAACCLSTVGKEMYPNARFVSLKEVTKDGFIVTGNFSSSEKGEEISINSKVALTFWWTATEKQVRIQGDAFEISEEEAIHYFKDRNSDSQLVSAIFNQSERMESITDMKGFFQQKKEEFTGKEIEKPKSWNGILIIPKRIEFMEFKTSRLHERTVFERKTTHWESYLVQP